jgi:PKHD-type hydroxylase
MATPPPLCIAIADAFRPEECDEIISLARPERMEAGRVWGGEAYGVDPGQRNVATSYHARDEAPAWLYDRLDSVFAAAGRRLGVGVAPLSEPIQILRYDVGSHFRTWHSDAGLDARSRRVLSLSVELSEAGDYEGGMLEIVPSLVGQPRSIPRGGAIVFPSQALHRVAPVTRGTRHSLVAWTGASGAG